MIRPLALGASLSLLPLAALAENITLVRCAPGGCTCAPSGLDRDDIAAETGLVAPEGVDDPVLVETDGQFAWSALSPQRLDLDMGGDGICMPDRQLFFDAPRTPVPGSATPGAAAAPGPETPAPAPTGGNIAQCAMVPLDGIWQPVQVAESFEACPAETAALIRPMMAPSLAPRPVSWGGRFAPEALSIGASGIEWTQIGPCNHIGRFPDRGSAALPVDIRYQTNLASPNLAVVNVTVEVGMQTDNPTVQAMLAAQGLAACEARLRFEFRRED